MSVLHVGQIKNKFHEYFDGTIDLADLGNRPEEEKEKAFLSRSLAAYAVSFVCGAAFPESAASVTDESGDGGIDAIYWDDIEKTLILVQAKWSHEGTGTIDEAGMLKFLNGTQKLLEANYDAFLISKADGSKVETKVFKKRAVVQNALRNANAKVVLVIAYTGTQGLATHPQDALSTFLSKHNNPTELLRREVLRLGDIHGSLDNLGKGSVTATIELNNWGLLKEPFESYYGQVNGSSVAELFTMFGARLFAPNLRVFLGSTPINDDIVSTAVNEPDRFWYSNNGITAICDAIHKLPYGGGETAFGVFECKGLSIVNGAQTVGSLHSAFGANPEAVKKSRVMIRLISLEKSPEFGDLITRRTNTQNGIGKRDFAALDDEQLRLQRELRLEGLSYAVKSGETIGDKNKGLDFAEAMTALACNHPDLMMTVTAKREVSRLWEDISKPPYSNLVTKDLHGLLLWKLVTIQRLVEEKLSSLETTYAGRNAQIIVHGNRLIQRMVIRQLRTAEKGDFEKVTAIDQKLVNSFTEGVAARLVEQVALPENGLVDAYPGNIFKNHDRCKDLEQKVLGA
jgi:hypothetical protein